MVDVRFNIYFNKVKDFFKAFQIPKIRGAGIDSENLTISAFFPIVGI